MSCKINALLLAALLATADTAHAQQVVDITVDVSEQEMYVQTPAGNALWPVSTGKAGHDTPLGEFTVDRMEPDWYSRKYDNAPMPHSLFFYQGYAIHGTVHVDALGRPASKGCVRLHPNAAKNLYEVIEYFGRENTVVRIVP